MGRRLGSTPFADILPSSLADDAGMRACARALDGVLDKATRAIPGLLIYSRLAKDVEDDGDGLARKDAGGRAGGAQQAPRRLQASPSAAQEVRPRAMVMDSGEESATQAPPLQPLSRLAALDGGLASLPEAVLDLLAWQFHVEGYASANGLAAKRAMIYASLLLHRRRGTPWAVRHGLETTLQIPVQVQEWFEYGGSPYFFRVHIDLAGMALDEQSAQEVMRLIMEHKNVRSWLDCLETRSRHDLNVTVGLGAFSRTTFSAVWLTTGTCPRLPIHAGCALILRTNTRIPRILTPDAPVRLAVIPATGAQTFTRCTMTHLGGMRPPDAPVRLALTPATGAQTFTRCTMTHLGGMRPPDAAERLTISTAAGAQTFTRSSLCPPSKP